MGSELEARIRNVTAVLGPTNTGKTHLAIERMLGHESGMIGLPLRLLAREVYDKIAARVGADKVALVTGEEKIRPERARYWVATVEAMPRDIDVDFLAIDEVQLAADPERGHVFTDRLLFARGRSETLLLGAATMREAIADLIPGANFISRPRLSKLSYAGEKKITRMPARSAVVAFSAAEVYAIAELIRRQRGGAAVVLGALSPRTRNAQVALYQSGDVEFLVATDAIGMGLNLDVDHVAFAGLRKFDGETHRELLPAELAQIAGRAGRHMNDGSFGVTGACEPFDHALVERLETHTFDSIRLLQWRNRSLSFANLDALHESLREVPNNARLVRARTADDVAALEAVSADPEIRALATSPAAVTKLWDVAGVPDYRKISGATHAELVATIYKHLMTGEQRLPEDWFAYQVSLADRTDGDIDTLSTRLSHIRTWTFVANRADWLKDPVHWQERTRAIEDSLSDALHECLTQRFVDRRTSALVKGMRDKETLEAEIAEDGAIKVENHYVGRLKGFRFTPETSSEGFNNKAARHAGTQVVTREFQMRARRVASAKADAFKLSRRGLILWRDEELAKLEPTEDPLKPSLTLLADEQLAGADREKVEARLNTWLTETINDRLKPLIELRDATDIAGLARGIAFRLVETMGALKRDAVAEEIKTLDQTARAQLRKYGVRFGAFNIFIPALLKPAPADLALSLWLLKNAANKLVPESLPEPPRPGLTSVAADPAVPDAFYRACGYHVCGPRAVRLDILERLADLIRVLLAWRPPGVAVETAAAAEPPAAAESAAASAETPAAAVGDISAPAADELPVPCAGEPALLVSGETAAPVADAARTPAPAPTPLHKSRPAVSHARTTPPRGASGDGAFLVTPDMMSILGCSPEELGNVLRALGFVSQLRPARARSGKGPAPTVAHHGSTPAAVVETQAGAVAIVEASASAPDAASDHAPVAPPAIDAGAPAASQSSADPSASHPSPSHASPPHDGGPAVEGAAVEAAEAVAAMASESPAAPPMEDVSMEEVWRPRRYRPERRERTVERRGEGADRRGERRDRYRAPQRDAATSSSGAPATAADPAATAGATIGEISSATESRGTGEKNIGGDQRRSDRDGARPRGSDNRGEGRPREGQGPDQARREGQGRREDSDKVRGRDRNDGRRGAGGVSRRRDEGPRRREDGPRRAPDMITAAPPRKDGIDPDNPFAKLKALREALENRTKEPSST